MIPITLRIKGLYSYQSEQVIDFQKLTAAHLFGIFGKVGSGKSSILEAITFALYGKTERLNLSGDNRNYNMLNLKSDELKIDFQFSAGKDNQVYKVLVQTKRNSKRFDDVKKMDRLAYKKKDTQWEPIDLSELEPAIGLNYDNFKRTVIIPQGKFQDFLQLGAKERSEMMKELFHLEKFELYYQTNSLEAENKSKLQHIDGQLQQLGDINAEAIQELEKQAQQLKEHIQKQKLELEQLQQEENQMKLLKAKSEELEENKAKRGNLLLKQEAVRKREEELAAYETCVLQFKSQLEKLHDEQLKLKQLNDSSQKIQLSINDKKKQYEELDTRLKTLELSYQKKDQQLKEVEELLKIAEINQAEQRASKLKERVNNGQKAISAEEEKEKELRKKKDALQAQLDQYEDKQLDLDLLNQIKQWFVKKNLLEEQLVQVEKEQKGMTDQFDDLKKQITELSKDDLLQELPENSTPSDYIKKIEALSESFSAKAEHLDKEREQLLIQHKLTHFASQLKHGEACPLCGSLEHPHPLESEDVSKEMEDKQKQRNQLNESLKRLQQLLTEFKTIHAQFLDKQKQSTLMLMKQNKMKQDIQSHKKEFKWEGFHSDNEYLIDKSIKEAQASNEIKKKQELELREYQKQLDLANENARKFRDAIQQFVQESERLQSRIETLKDQLQLLNYEELKAQPSDKLKAEAEQKHKAVQQLVKDYEACKQSLENLGQLLSAESASLKTLQEQKALGEEAYQKLQTQLSKQLEESKFASLQEVKELLAKAFDLPRERKLIEEYKQNLALLNQNIEKLEEALKEKSFNKEAYAQLQAKLQAFSEQFNQQNQKLGEIETQIKESNQRFEKLKDLLKEKQELDKRAENLALLKKLFKGSGFVNYVSSVHLQNLCNAANHRFYKLTGQKLQLELSEDNSFQVRDFMNGGNLRSIKTLSGGQMFQASLCLAIALVDNIQKMSQSSHNFFFLDEGFGSLDKDSLQIVFDTLKALRKENRVVGIISHVEDMQQEIGVHLNVINKEETGSVIHTSWEV